MSSTSSANPPRSRIGDAGANAMSKSISEADDQSAKQAGDSVKASSEGLNQQVQATAPNAGEAGDRAAGRPGTSGNASRTADAAADPAAPRHP